MTVNRHLWLAVAVWAFVVTLMGILLVSQPVRAAGPWYVATTGSDGNTCLSAVSPCATINGALGKASPGDTIYVATGTYTSTSGSEVVAVTKSINLSGGWNSAFTHLTGMSTIDGQLSRLGFRIASSDVTASVDHFIIQNGLGGGISNFTGNLTVLNSKIINNVSADCGGGIISFGNPGTFTLINSVVSGNVAYSGGGGICDGTMAIISNSIISGNTMGRPGTVGGGGGGGIYSFGLTLVLNNSTVSGNTIQGGFSGAGIESLGGSGVTVNNSTISGNTNGEGIHTFGSPVTLNSSTISGNQGHGLRTEGGAVTLQNTIIANNGISSGSDCYNAPGYSGTINSLGYNLVRNNSNCTLAGTDLTSVDPQLGPLQDNGGPTPTQALLPGSPAINASNPAGCTDNFGVPLPFDQRGYPRVGRCDIGAYEYGSSPSLFFTKGVVGTFQPSGFVTYTLILNNIPNIDLTNVSLTDSLPIQVTYVPNSFTVTNGAGAVNEGTLFWAGTVFSNTPTVISFGAMISITAQNAVIINKAASSWREYAFSAAATFDTFSHHVHFPLVARNYCTGPFYTDDFSNPASGWPVGNSANVQYGYLSGEYRLLLKNTNWSLLVSPGLKASDSIVAVDVRDATGVYGSYGLLFGLSDDFSQFYDFEIYPSGNYAIYRYGSGTLTALVQGSSGSIHPGTATNRIKLERNGSLIKAYANGQLLANVSDGSYTGLRRVGLIAFSYNQPNVDVRFDNFKAYDVACEAIATSLSSASQMTDKAAVAIEGLSGSGTMTPGPHPRLDILPAGMSPHLSEDRSHHP